MAGCLCPLEVLAAGLGGDADRLEILAIILLGLVIFGLALALGYSRGRVRSSEQRLFRSEAQTGAILANLVDAVITIDEMGKIEWFTPSAERLFGWRADEVLGRNIKLLMPAPYAGAHDSYLARYRAGGPRHIIGIGREVAGLRKDGTVFPMDLAISEAVVEGRRLFTGTVRDITARKQAEKGLLLADSIYRNTADGIMVTDTDGTILSVNPAFSLITGYSAEEAVGATPRLLRSEHHDAAFYEDMWRALLDIGNWRGEIWNRRKGGELYLQRQTITLIPGTLIPGDQGREAAYVAVFEDITERHRDDERLRHLAFHDALTGLANRPLFEDRLRHTLALAERESRRLALMFLDLDGFKPVNDDFGHEVGDDVLRAVAARLLEIVRATDTVARLGGDEFVVLLHNPTDRDEVVLIARRIIASVNEPLAVRGQVARVGCSIGLALYPDHAIEAGELLKCADGAMYAAKAAGKNVCRFCLEEAAGGE